MAQNGEVLSRMTLADAAGIFVEGNVQAPMQLILDPPVAAHGVLDGAGVAGQTADVIAGLDGNLIANAPFELDLRDRAQRLPLAPLAQVTHIAWVGNGPTVADLQPAMPFGRGADVIMLDFCKINAVRPLKQPRDV